MTRYLRRRADRPWHPGRPQWQGRRSARMRLAGTLGLCILAGAAIAAADFWDEKAFTTWSDKEVEKMLSDSPWARTFTIAIRAPLRGGGGDGGLGGGGGGRGGGGRRGDPFLTSTPRRMRLTVMWRNALPVKQATVRQRAGRDAPLSTDDREFIAQSEPQYVVSVSGLPRRVERLVQNRAVLSETVLKRKNKGPDLAR